MLIGLMSLPNQVVYIQFHPVAYMVKLNIEMSMASLITRLAKNNDSGFRFNSLSYSQGPSGGQRTNPNQLDEDHRRQHETGLKSFHQTSIGLASAGRDLEATHPSGAGIHRRVDVEVSIESPKSTPSSIEGHHDDAGSGNSFYRIDDEDSLTSHPGHPQSSNKKD